MSELDELSIALYEDGIERIRELDRVVLSKGAWTTLLYRYQEWNQQQGAYGPSKYSIRRYQKKNNQYWQKSKFNISSDEQARKIIETLGSWLQVSQENKLDFLE